MEALSKRDMWQRACDLGSAEGCHGLGELLRDSRKTRPAAVEALMDAKAYQAFVESEAK